MDPTPAVALSNPALHPAVARVLTADPNDPRGVWFPSDFVKHPKVARLTDAAFRLWAAGIDYCSRHLTDGFIPREVVSWLAGGRVRKRLIEELLETIPPYGPLWELDPARNGYRVHDYLDWNPSGAEVRRAEEETRDGIEFDDDGRALRWRPRAVRR
jgi:hypothetical protein